MNQLEGRYHSGEVVPSHDFVNPKGLQLYGEVVHLLWRQDKSTQQPNMFGEVFLQRVVPPLPTVEAPQPSIHLEGQAALL